MGGLDPGMTAVMGADPRIDRADKILSECGDMAAWPHGREARSALEWARDTLLEALDAHARLLGPYAPFCEARDDAEDAAAVTAEDAALHLQKVLSEYKRREAAAVAARNGGTG